MRKLSDDECPLYLRLCAGPSEKVLSLVLKENETGDVNVSFHKFIWWMYQYFLDKPMYSICYSWYNFTNCSPPQWDAFSFPELCNFLRILQREEEERVRQIVKRYALAREKMKQAMARITTPGWLWVMQLMRNLWYLGSTSCDIMDIFYNNIKGKERA